MSLSDSSRSMVDITPEFMKLSTSPHLGRAPARPNLTFPLHSSLSIIIASISFVLSAPVSSSRQSTQETDCLPLRLCPVVGCQSTSRLAISSLCLTQCPAILKRRSRMTVVILFKLPYSSTLVSFAFQEILSAILSMRVYVPSIFLLRVLEIVQVSEL